MTNWKKQVEGSTKVAFSNQLWLGQSCLNTVVFEDGNIMVYNQFPDKIEVTYRLIDNTVKTAVFNADYNNISTSQKYTFQYIRQLIESESN